MINFTTKKYHEYKNLECDLHSRRPTRTGENHVPSIAYTARNPLRDQRGGGDDWERIEDYANNYREDLLRMREKLSGTALNIARMPSPDTFNRVFQIIDPMGFKSACKAFVRAVYKGITGKDIAIDGKTPQGVKWVGSSSPAHIVSAYCPAHQFVVDYLKSEEKGGELALMLALLELLTLEERTVAIDTAGTHTDVVENIQS